MATFNGVASNDVLVCRGLRQGCPLSPVLYMLYTSDIERALERTGIGFFLQHTLHGDVVSWRLPGLAFAGDIVLTADNLQDMKVLLIACETEAARLRLRFNAEKSAIALSYGEMEDLESLTIQNSVLPVSTKYKYLGVTLTTSADYLAEHHQNLKTSALRKRNVLRRRLGNTLSDGKERSGTRRWDVTGEANQLVKGDLGWSSFEAREASSKLEYYARCDI
ncbi:hypothetical protein HPB47_000987 [Ixodes persulcatus]|uniref:Uncharacterized protein n=1 Tax=Ixodes persulcatus TaxID=34615 RepID=A0AC60PQB4_IXOPE|nr:hypothetical protein HPB47_000987 [Ixodes persulcatus]